MRRILEDSEDPLGLAGLLENFACQYVQADSDVKSRILKDGIENGRGDVIIGFESAYLTGTLSDMSLSSKNKVTLHGSGGGIGGEKSGQVEGRRHSVVGSVFKVVHVQRRVLGTGTHRIRIMGRPFTLRDLGDNMLQDMFREAFPSLARRTKKTVQRVVGGIFRKNASDRADQQGNHGSKGS
ncbi:expressed unknown protein [Seminavis robusta]|uniref:Uncharacterized protein n=1 Tax=Seminavis robusta TaxID=568900 RepID=A0A9N8F168_9STRA|nr:expressed unknown protein [Seminavis robusta]|eukprot:Sro3962_g352210.1 n/a (182) ;mRNA; f:48-593